MILEKTKDGEMWYDVYSRLVKDRIIWLNEEIDADSASSIAATMLFLDSQDSKKDITLYINTPGGTVSDGMCTIYDTMQFVKSPIKTVCVGLAASGGAIILAAGSKGKRKAFQNSKIMIHGIQAYGLGGSHADVKIEAEEILKTNNSLIEILARHSGKTFKDVFEDVTRDKYLTAQEALEYGIIDEIVEPSKQIPELTERKAKKTTRSSKKTIK